jgi:hypothetical protein
MSQTLPTELDGLLYRAHVARGDTDETWAFLLELAEYTARGEVTETQARAFCDMVGISHAEHAATVKRARSVN